MAASGASEATEAANAPGASLGARSTRTRVARIFTVVRGRSGGLDWSMLVGMMVTSIWDVETLRVAALLEWQGLELGGTSGSALSELLLQIGQ